MPAMATSLDDDNHALSTRPGNAGQVPKPRSEPDANTSATAPAYLASGCEPGIVGYPATLRHHPSGAVPPGAYPRLYPALAIVWRVDVCPGNAPASYRCQIA